MSSIPAICNKCNFIFPTNLFKGDFIVQMTNIMYGPCPRCGSTGHVPDGTYRLIGDIIQVLDAPQKNIGELKELFLILQKTKNDKLTFEEMHREIEKNTTNLSGVNELLQKGRENKKEDIKFIITTILAVLSILISIYALKGEEKPNVNIEQVINNIYIMQEADTNMDNNYIQVHNRKIQRNDMCTCGSGIKYKFCHGK